MKHTIETKILFKSKVCTCCCKPIKILINKCVKCKSM